jgi:predicted GNAT family N-acyltransferase
VRVARTLDDLMQVMNLRAIVYMGEQACPHEEEFDGNDFAGATHLLAFVDGEPAGVMRMRWFAGFAKAERAAVRNCFRGADIGFALMDEALSLAARKGYEHVLGHVEPDLVRFWRRRQDVSVRVARPAFTFSDRSYVEVLFSTPAGKAPLSIDSPALVLNRPEGEWDEPGVLDRSAARYAAVG